MTEQQQIKLFQRYFNKSASTREVDTLVCWLRENDENKITFDAYNKLWHEAHAHTRKQILNVDEQWLKIAPRLSDTSITSNYKPSVFTRNSFLKVAAIVAIILGLSFIYLYQREIKPIEANDKWLVAQTTKGERKKIEMVDGTTIWLNSATTLEYCLNNKKRAVRLKGEAYFEVAKNEEVPFCVNTDMMELTVLGTKFNVSSYSHHNQLKAALKDGSIEVKTLKEKVILKPGQEAVINRGEQDIQVITIDPGVVGIWQYDQLQFRSTTFNEMIPKLEKWFQVTIKCTNKDFAKSNYTITIKKESVEEVLTILQFTSDMQFDIKGNEVIIR